MTKPIIQDAEILDGNTGKLFKDFDMFEVKCGKCGQSFGLSTGKKNETDYFRENFLFCNKCGEPVDWSEENPE